MKKKLAEKIREALTSVLPITAIVLLLSFTLAPLPVGTMLMFLMGAVMLILGMGFFSLGADIVFDNSDGAVMTIGRDISSRSRRSNGNVEIYLSGNGVYRYYED